MATHVVGTSSKATVQLSSVPVFEGQCLVPVTALGAGTAAATPVVVCQKGGAAHSVEDCEACPRFHRWEVDHDTGEVQVRCRWPAFSPVSTRMTRTSALVTVTPQTPCAQAAQIARMHGVHHLPVLSAGHLVGLICLCDLFPRAEATELVADRMSGEILAVDHGATLAEVAATMRMFKVGALPVIADGILTGLITRTDLRRVGVPARLLGAATD
jgi:CBS-domain-containing membrane protein